VRRADDNQLRHVGQLADQARNRDDVRERLAELIRGVLLPPKKRVATKPTRASKERRLAGKQQRGRIKQTRSRKPEFE
jgi:ribosome-associated protein